MPRSSARILNSALGFQGFLPHSGAMMTPSRFSVLGHRREVRTTTNGGVLRLLAPLEFSEDRCVGRLLAVNANPREHERDIASTDICCNTSEWRAHPPLNSGLSGVRDIAAATAMGANPVMRRNRR
jgi:hypothetical protein